MERNVAIGTWVEQIPPCQLAGVTRKISASMFSGILDASPIDGAYLWAMALVSIRSGLSVHSLMMSNPPTVPLVPTNGSPSALLQISPKMT